MSQKNQIKHALLRGEHITPMDALDRFGCFRLAPKICELRQEGMPIKTLRNRAKGYAIYRLQEA